MTHQDADNQTLEVREAWCAGQRVQVSGRQAALDHRKVGCPSCGVRAGLDCTVIGSRGTPMYEGHQARNAKARVLYGALRS